MGKVSRKAAKKQVEFRMFSTSTTVLIVILVRSNQKEMRVSDL